MPAVHHAQIRSIVIAIIIIVIIIIHIHTFASGNNEFPSSQSISLHIFSLPFSCMRIQQGTSSSLSLSLFLRVYKVLVNKLQTAYKKYYEQEERGGREEKGLKIIFILVFFTARHHSVSRVLLWKLLHSSLYAYRESSSNNVVCIIIALSYTIIITAVFL